MRTRTVLLGILLVCLVVDVASARGRRSRSRRSRVEASVSYGGTSGSAQAIAEYTANLQASRGECFHPDNSFGGASGSYEGVGAGMSAAAALNNCCRGSGPIIGQAVVRSLNGMFYACRRYQ